MLIVVSTVNYQLRDIADEVIPLPIEIGFVFKAVRNGTFCPANPIGIPCFVSFSGFCRALIKRRGGGGLG